MIKLVDDEDVKTMVIFYCWIGSVNTEPIQLFTELADIKPAEDFTPLSEKYGVQDLCTRGLNDINDESVNDNGNVYASSVGNPSRDIFIRNDLGANMSIVDPNAAHASEFPEYPDILPTHRLAVDPEHEVLFVGQKFATKEDCVFSIKRHSMNVSVDKKVTMSKSTIHIGEVLEDDRRVQLAGTSCIYLEVTNVGDLKICWASYIHFCTYDIRSLQT
ncbi:hypothetical protein GOBAR_DD04912 [Gossypium barbadense]|nr:hypothetical protein GOBAR_DD04912 [Gossypium barbadense]